MSISTPYRLGSRGAAFTAEAESRVVLRRRVSNRNSPSQPEVSRKFADWRGIADSIALENAVEAEDAFNSLGTSTVGVPVCPNISKDIYCDLAGGGRNDSATEPLVRGEYCAKVISPAVLESLTKGDRPIGHVNRFTLFRPTRRTNKRKSFTDEFHDSAGPELDQAVRLDLNTIVNLLELLSIVEICSVRALLIL